MNDILDHPTSTILLAYDVALDGTINKEKIFNCFDCRVPVIMYAGHVAVVYPGRERSSWWIGEDYVKFPLTVQCKNNECRHR